MLATIDDIAEDLISRLMPSDLDEIANGYPSFESMERIWFESSMLREIRNQYGLWHDNPLTEKWRTDETSRDIHNGVDHSEDHPDNVSVAIYKRVKELLTK